MTDFTVFKSDSHDHTGFIVNMVDHIKYSVLGTKTFEKCADFVPIGLGHLRTCIFGSIYI